MTDGPDGGLVGLNVNLTRAIAQALTRSMEMSGESHTVCVNRAIGLYAKVVERILLPGNTLVIRQKDGQLFELMPWPDEDSDTGGDVG